MMDDVPSFEEFLGLEDEEVASVVSSCPDAQVCVLVPDGNRKAGLLLWGLDPSAKDFNEELFTRMHSKLLEVVRTFFTHGIKVLLIPAMTVKNFKRGRAFLEAAMSSGLSHFFHDRSWLDLYDEHDIRVRFYGDRDQLHENGFDDLLDWMKGLEERTRDNDGAVLFLGFACERSLEEVRLASIGAEIVSRTGRPPSRAELVRSVYGEDVPEVGLFVRPTEVRDSDMLPVLISGYRTQMYFPLGPVGFLSKRTIRSILYDLIFQRHVSVGKKMYTKEDLDDKNIYKVRDYYLSNLETVIGLGRRIGPFWLPSNDYQGPG